MVDATYELIRIAFTTVYKLEPDANYFISCEPCEPDCQVSKISPWNVVKTLEKQVLLAMILLVHSDYLPGSNLGYVGNYLIDYFFM